MRIKKVQVFDFDELEPGIREKVINQLSDINIDFDWYADELTYWKNKLRLFGFMESRIYFSGFESQGDGACFDCKCIDIEKAWKYFKADMKRQNGWTYRKIKTHEDWLFDYLYNYVMFEIQCLNSRYCHENSQAISSYSYRPTNGLLDRFYTEFEEWLENFRRGLCDQIYRELSDEYEYLISDTAIKETIRLSKYEFTEEGLIA